MPSKSTQEVTREADATFVAQARELAENGSKDITDFLAKGHKEVSRLHAKMKDDKFTVEQDDILIEIPPEIADVIRNLAWDSGHGNGHREVLIHTEKYADALRLPLKAYTQRILKK